MYTPYLMCLIECSKSSSGKSSSVKLKEQLAKLESLLLKIKPRIEYKDQIWSFWLRTERGPIEEYGNFEELKEEGEFETFDQFKEYWEMEFQGEVQWHELGIVKYENTLFFVFAGKLEFQIDLKTYKFSNIDVKSKETKELLLWLFNAAISEIKKFLKDPRSYNSDIRKNLPLTKRYGRIRRSDLWECSPEYYNQSKKLGKEKVRKFTEIVKKNDESKILASMSLKDFLSCCEIAYDANEYKFKKGSSPKEKYNRMADLRDGGMLDLPEDNAEAFCNWYHSGAWSGCHPWEICRGGNSTHITLQPADQKNGWQLYLDGFSNSRCVETAKMAIALYEKKIPFILSHKEGMLRMILGEDYIGIVPEGITPRYCHGSFPEKDKIFDFMNLWTIEEDFEKLKDKIHCYPVDKLMPANSTAAA